MRRDSITEQNYKWSAIQDGSGSHKRRMHHATPLPPHVKKPSPVHIFNVHCLWMINADNMVDTLRPLRQEADLADMT